MRLFPVIAATAAIIATPAMAAQNGSSDFAVTVQHEDLDLTTRDGVSRLDERVRTRIRQMCATGSRDGASIRAERKCQAAAFASAESGIRLAIAQANANAVRLASNSAASDANTPGA